MAQKFIEGTELGLIGRNVEVAGGAASGIVLGSEDDSDLSTDAMQLSSTTELVNLLRQANCPDGDTEAVVRLLNAEHGCCATYNTIFGTLVAQGCIGLLSHRGRIEAVGAGRWIIGFHRVSWMRPANLRDDVSVCDNVTIVRIRRGSMGCAWDGGTPILLGEGLHVYNSNTFKFDRTVEANKEYLNHGTIHILRVPKGKLAMVSEGVGGSMQPKLLPEGMHVTDSPMFVFSKTVDVSETNISHGNLHLVRVNKGWVGKVVQDNVPKLLGEGSHWRNSTNFQYVGVQSQMDDLIKHGTITRFRIRKGQVAFAWNHNEPLLMQEPGEYQFDTPLFQFVKFASASEQTLELGARKIITVQSGEVGISFNMGQLEILAPGRHVIEKAEHRVESFWSTQQRPMRLASTSDHTKKKDDAPADLLICETKDFVKVGVRADVFFSIEDPYKCVVAVGMTEFEPLVRETSISTLTNIIRSTALAEMAQSKLPTAVSETKALAEQQNAQATGSATAPLFFDRAHDAFLAKLHDDFIQRYGINISNIRIESFKIMDESLATEISKQAVVTAKTQSTLANLQGETEIATAIQERDATVRKIEAAAAAGVLDTQTKSQNNAQIAKAEANARSQQIETELQAQAEGNALLSRARAEADATRIKADADAHAISVCADAEAKRADLLSKTAIGGQLALLDTYKEMVARSNEGVSKVVYMDPSLAQSGNPLAMLSLQGMAAELGALQRTGAS